MSANDLWKDTLDYKHGWEGVRLAGDELISVARWISNHACANGPQKMRITIAQSAKSGIGTNTIVKCACGVGADVTDYASW